MGFYVADARAMKSCERLSCADLITDGMRNFSWRKGDEPSSKADQILECNMRADCNIFFFRKSETSRHYIRVASMKAAGDIGACYKVEHGVVVAHTPMTETFPKICIEIDRFH